MNDEELHELIALLAVDALTGSEREEAEQMVEQRPELGRELDELREALGALAEVQRRDPPPGLRGKVLAEAARTPQEPPGAASTLTEPAPARSADVVPIEARRRRRPWLFAAAAVVVAFLAGAALLVGPFADDDSQAERIAAVIEAPDAVRIPMTGELEGLAIVHSAEEDAAVLAGSDVPVPEGDRVYELWAIRDAPERVDIFRPDEDGDLEVLLEGLDPDSANSWAMTEEAAGGADEPTPPILAST